MKACFLFHKYDIPVRIVSDVQALAFGSTLCILYNTVAHIVLYPCNCEHVFVTAL